MSKGCDYGYISWNAPGQQIAEGPTASPRQSPSLINGSRASFCSDVDISKKRGKKKSAVNTHKIELITRLRNATS